MTRRKIYFFGIRFQMQAVPNVKKKKEAEGMNHKCLVYLQLKGFKSIVLMLVTEK